MKKILVVLFLSFVAFFACNKEDVTEKTFDIVNYHTYFVEEIINPATNEFVTNITNLDTAIIKFSSNSNEGNLTLLRTAWKNAAISFSKTEVGNVGTIQNSAIYLSIYSWGANETAIEDFITSTTTISESSMNSLPTKTRGLSAIEYLIFDKNLTETVLLFSTQRRIDFLTSLSKNLLKKTNSLENQWKNYSDSFINNSSSGLNGSINMIVNQINFLLENVRRFKIGEPSGIENTRIIDASLLQADKSGISLKIIEQNIKSIKEAYYGTALGLDDYVSSIASNEDLNTKISTVFSSIENDISSLSNTSLKSAIISNNTIVNQLYNNIKALMILLKVDVASILSITVTFTDNDGDS